MNRASAIGFIAAAVLLVMLPQSAFANPQQFPQWGVPLGSYIKTVDRFNRGIGADVQAV